MLTINYSRLGESYPDFQAERVVMQAKDRLGKQGVLTVSTINVVRAAQLMIAEGKLDPIDVRFQYDNNPIRHDRYGRFFEFPEGYDETIMRLHSRYRKAIQNRILNEMTGPQREQYDARFKEWFEANISDIFTAAVPATDDQPAVAATAFIFDPESVGKKQITPSKDSDVHHVQGFGETAHGVIVVVTEKCAIPLHLVQQATFDMDGYRMVPRPFNTAAVLDELGFDGGFFARPGFEVE